MRQVRKRLKCKNHFCHKTFYEDGQKRFCSPNCQQYWNGTGRRRHARGERYRHDPKKPYKPRDLEARMKRKIEMEEFRKEFEIKRNLTRGEAEIIGGLLADSLAKAAEKPKNLLEIAKERAARVAEIPDLPDLPVGPLEDVNGYGCAVADDLERERLAALLGVEL